MDDDGKPEIFASHFGGVITANDSSGKSLPGWPSRTHSEIPGAASAADLDGDGLDEILDDMWRTLHAFHADGSPVLNWPVLKPDSSGTHIPAIGDLDDDGDLEIVSASNVSTPGREIYAWHHDGVEVDGFPVHLDEGDTPSFPVLGDVDGDQAVEVVVLGAVDSSEPRGIVILSSTGVIERKITLPRPASCGPPALADLTGDSIPEIVVVMDEAVTVVAGDGTTLPGWSQTWTRADAEWTSPVIGDIDGDGEPDLAFTMDQKVLHHRPLRSARLRPPRRDARSVPQIPPGT